MKKENCICIGSILKSHGIKGELSVKFESHWLLRKGSKKQKFLFAEIYPEDELVPFFIEASETDHRGHGRIKFSDFNTIESTQVLVNKKIFVPSDLYPLKIQEKIINEDLVGYSVTEKESGEIGIIDAVFKNSHQQTLLIKKGENDLLIPMVDEFIVKIDQKNRILFMKFPEGLIEINQ